MAEPITDATEKYVTGMQQMQYALTLTWVVKPGDYLHHLKYTVGYLMQRALFFYVIANQMAAVGFAATVQKTISVLPVVFHTQIVFHTNYGLLQAVQQLLY